MIGREQLLNTFRELGVRAGAVVLVHSALRRMGPIEGGADGVIDTLIAATAPGGLVAVPTHTWATVNDQQPVFHQTYSPSHVGTLTNVLRLRPDAKRSLHPTHSVAAVGARAEEFVAGHESDTTPCSPTGPYGKLIDWCGKVLLLGVDLTRCTFFHCLEELAGLGEIWSLGPARPKHLIRADGALVHVMARAHSNAKSDNYGRIEPDLLTLGILRRLTIHDAPVMALDAAACAQWMVPKLRANPHLFW